MNTDNKNSIIADTLYGDNAKNFFSFTVCRNPVDKLLSVYNYLRDMFLSGNLKSSSKLATQWTIFHDAAILSLPLPTWKEFLNLTSKDTQNVRS